MLSDSGMSMILRHSALDMTSVFSSFYSLVEMGGGGEKERPNGEERQKGRAEREREQTDSLLRLHPSPGLLSTPTADRRHAGLTN